LVAIVKKARVGQGFTLKAAKWSDYSASELYLCRKPNNGLITTNSVGRNQLLLQETPYPSALDADAFIRDNLNVRL
jgi:hypothetical protein